MKHLTIEFVGLPGAGKTSLAAALAARLRARGVRVLDPLTRFSSLPRFVRAILKLFLATIDIALAIRESRAELKIISRSRQESLLDLLSVTLNWFFVKGIRTLSRCTTTVTILDQGLIQAVWSIALKGKLHADQLARTLLPPIVNDSVAVIFVDAVPAQIVGRLQGRAGRLSRLERRMGDKQLLNRAVAEGDRIKNVLQSLKHERGFPLLVINNSMPDSFVLCVEEMLRFLEDLLGGAPDQGDKSKVSS